MVTLQPYWDVFAADYATAYNYLHGEVVIAVDDLVASARKNGLAVSAEDLIQRSGYQIVEVSGVWYVNFGKPASTGILEEAVHNLLSSLIRN